MESAQAPTSAAPASPIHRGQFDSLVVANIPLCREHYRLVLHLPVFPPTRPGQFIQIACRRMDIEYSPEREVEWSPGEPLDVAGRELMTPLALLRRPFSLAGRRDSPDGVELDVIHRVVGQGTAWMAELRAGEPVNILGPLGNTFELPPPGQTAILVGGGVGIPPMLYLAEALRGRAAVAFSGALNRDLLPLTIDEAAPPPAGDEAEPLMNIAEFASHGIRSVITTDDGSYGFRGLVTQALEEYLEAAAGAEFRAIIYTCGPEPMMKRVAEIAAMRGIECQIAVERAMACGMGTCQSCCIRVRKADPAAAPLAGRQWAYRLACTDGPVFRGTDLLW